MEHENPLSIKNYDDNKDQKLIEHSLLGDKKSLNALLQKNQDYIFNIALKMLNNIPDAQDATQEILIKIVTNLSSYDATKSRLRTWIYRISFNHILNVKKAPHEKNEITFTKFFNFIGSTPDIAITKEEEETSIMGYSIKEAQISCTAGMLMCLNREQRLIYIVGDIFRIDHNLASEIFEITPSNFRKKLSRTRKDLHQWMHKKCGLVNQTNPCRCKNKTKKFIELGIVNPSNFKWQSDYRKKIFEKTERKLEDMGDAIDHVNRKIYREDPFKNNVRANQVYDEILNHKDFSKFMDL